MTTPHSSGFDVTIRESVRPLAREDRAEIEVILRASSNFTDDEKTTALELVDAALAGDPDYIINVLEDAAGDVSGYECHGPTPLTAGTFDLYWIVVDPRVHKRGYGKLLLQTAEEDVAERGGRLLLIETSSQPSYEPTIEFYKRNAYRLEARVRDFYRVGDDKLIFAKNV